MQALVEQASAGYVRGRSPGSDWAPPRIAGVREEVPVHADDARTAAPITIATAALR